MNKRQLIDEIREFNPTAHPQFLEQFDAEALAQYLKHLKAAEEKRIHIHGWVRSRSGLRKVS